MLDHHHALGLVLASSVFAVGCGADGLPAESADPDATPPPVIPKDAQAPEQPGESDPLDAGVDSQPGDAGEEPREDCPGHTRALYLIDRSLLLWKLVPDANDPAASVLSEVGEVACPGAGSALPRALAVERSGRAWVELGDYAQSDWAEQLFALDLVTGACTATTYEPGDALIPAPFAMAFAGGQENQTLLLAAQGEEPYRLAMLDTESLAGAALRAGAMGEAQLAGTAAGKLYGLYAAPTPHIAEVDWGAGVSQTSYELAAQPVTLGAYTAFTLAAEGDSLWAFFLKEGEAGTEVFHVATGDGKVTAFTLGEHAIVAAGASTCLTD